MNRYVSFAALILFSLLVCAGCVRQTPTTDVPELRPGILQGYLPQEDHPDSLALLPPPPAEGSAGFAMDKSVNEKAVALNGTPRFEQAAKDADLSFPALANTFSCALGIPISMEDTPHLYVLLRRSFTDIGLSTYAAKNHYKRTRPFVMNGLPTCSPKDEEHLRHDGSYPSGHTATGWGLALVLVEVAPERTDALLARGREFGESRLVCNVHWYSDIVAGRMVAAGAVARLHGNEEFRRTVEVAREEYLNAKAKNLMPQVDCAAEKEALGIKVPLQ